VDRTTGGFGVVVNPRALRGRRAALWEEALARLRQTRSVECMRTAGDGGDRDRIAALIESTRPSIVIAAGGDGTVHEVVGALLGANTASAPALGILPLGTANNVARSLGLRSFRTRDGDAALSRAVTAVLGGRERLLDLGRVGPDVFVGAFAVGMDGAILAARNRWRRRWRLGPRVGGYALYLLSCAVNLASQRARIGRLAVDGVEHDGPLYNVLFTNTPLYAGEFRFDSDDHSADGRLDLHVFRSPLDYVRAFVTAWRRHVHRERGEVVDPPVGVRRIQHVEITLSAPFASQLDGEEYARADRFDVCVIPHAIRVCVPRDRH
jgi:diacylglycerol kinase family enzyme